MQLTTRQQAILTGIAADVAHYRTATTHRDANGWEVAQAHERAADAQRGVVRSNPTSWLGTTLPPGAYSLLSRDYRRLESLGLIEKLARGFGGTRTTHFRLTTTGKELAESLAVHDKR